MNGNGRCSASSNGAGLSCVCFESMRAYCLADAAAVLDESSLIGTFLLNVPANHFPCLEGQLWGATLWGRGGD